MSAQPAVLTPIARPPASSTAVTLVPVRTWPLRFEAALRGEGQVLRAALRNREADVLLEHGQRPAEYATAGRVRRYIGMHGVAGQQQWAAVAGENLRTQSARR
jgi:hypothetical protein